MYEETFPSLRAAAAALYAAAFRAKNVTFFLWCNYHLSTYSVADAESFRAYSAAHNLAPFAVIFRGTIRDLAQLAEPLPPSLNLETVDALPPSPIQDRPQPGTNSTPSGT